MTKWTRENDATIARVAEGLKVTTWADKVGPAFFASNGPRPDVMKSALIVDFGPGPGDYDYLPEYDKDEPAGVLALEAWRAKFSGRSYSLYSPNADSTVFLVVMYDGRCGLSCIKEFDGSAVTLGEAIARALLAACEGAENQ